jgi:D-alanyl-D-alanine carboxypeptidase
MASKGEPLRRTAVFALVGLTVAIAATSAFGARYASIIIEQKAGRVLHAANPDRRAYPASLTKMMTLYMMFEALESGRPSVR